MDIGYGIKKMLEIIPSIKARSNFSMPSSGRSQTWSFVGDKWVMGVDSSKSYIEDAYKSTPYVYAIVSAIADKCSSPSGHVYRGKEIIEDHEFIKKLESPNPLHTGKTFREEFYGYALLTGNAFMYAERGDATGALGDLWTVPSPCVSIKYGNRLKPIAGYKISYMQNRPVKAEQMAHMTYFNPSAGEEFTEDNIMGMSPLKSLRGVVQQSGDAQTAQGTLFNNMHPSGILSGDGNDEFDEEQARSIQDRFRQYHTGVHKGGDIVVTPAKVSWQSIGISPVDLRLIEADANFLQKIAAVYKFPKELIMGDESYANSVIADKQLVTKAVLPVISRFDECMTKFLRTFYNDNELYYRTDLEYFTELSSNKKDLSEWLNRSWWLTVNEKRVAMEYEPIEGMDILMMPSNHLPYEDFDSLEQRNEKPKTD